jgi:hypothetical protein
MKKLGALEIGLIVGALLLVVLLFVNRGCSTCKNRLAQIQGALPGAGPGVLERSGNASGTVSAE